MELKTVTLNNKSLSDIIKELEIIKSQYGDLKVCGLNEECIHKCIDIVVDRINKHTDETVVEIF